MTKEDILALHKVVGDMRFMQATALVASGMQNNKAAKDYMAELGRLDKLLEKEALK